MHTMAYCIFYNSVDDISEWTYLKFGINWNSHHSDCTPDLQLIGLKKLLFRQKGIIYDKNPIPKSSSFIPTIQECLMWKRSFIAADPSTKIYEHLPVMVGGKPHSAVNLRICTITVSGDAPKVPLWVLLPFLGLSTCPYETNDHSVMIGCRGTGQRRRKSPDLHLYYIIYTSLHVVGILDLSCGEVGVRHQGPRSVSGKMLAVEDKFTLNKETLGGRNRYCGIYCVWKLEKR